MLESPHMERNGDRRADEARVLLFSVIGALSIRASEPSNTTHCISIGLLGGVALATLAPGEMIQLLRDALGNGEVDKMLANARQSLKAMQQARRKVPQR